MTKKDGDAPRTVTRPLSKSHCSVAADLGAGSGRLIAGQIIDGRLCLREISRFSTSFAKDPRSGYLCWPIDSIEEQVHRGIGTAAKLARVASVGVDSWSVDYVLLDTRMRRIGDAVCYRDNRIQGAMERVTSRIPAAEIFRRTGIQFQTFNTIFQLAAMATQEPQWVRDASHLLMIPDYLHYCLSGVLANEYSNASTTQMLGLNGKWDPDLFAAAQLPEIWMRPPVEAGTVLGQMHLGDTTIKVVAPATHDTASAVAGTPFEDASEVFISSGTWSLMGIESTIPFASDQAMQWNFSNEGGFGHHYRVLKNIMGLWILQRLCNEFQIEICHALECAAIDVGPWRSIINPDDARFLNPSSMRKAIHEYLRETHQPVPESPGEYARCVVESLALSYRHVKEQLESLRGQRLTRIRVVGGGSNNQLLNQLCADSCLLPVSAGPVEASALGNICVQMIALGEIGGLDEARALIRQSFRTNEYYPRAEVPDDVWRRFQQYVASSAQEIVQ